MKFKIAMVFMTARLVLSMPHTDLTLFEAPAMSCPIDPFNAGAK